MEYLVAIIAGLFGLLLYQTNKRKGAEAQNKNNEVLNEVKDLDRSILSNKEKLQAEEAKREAINEEADKDVSKSLDDLAKFLGKRE